MVIDKTYLILVHESSRSVQRIPGRYDSFLRQETLQSILHGGVDSWLSFVSFHDIEL